jgi:hypothetical protein
LPVVTFTAPTSGASATFGAASAVSSHPGQLEVTATPNHIASATAYTVSASALLPSGTKTTITPQGFSLTNLVGAPIVTVRSGSGQTVVAPHAFTSLVANVADLYGNPIATQVTFTINRLNGNYLATFASSAKSVPVTSTTAGVATAPTLTSLSVVGGTFTVTASAGSSTTTFSLTVQINDPIVSAPQSATVGKSYAQRLEALVTDPFGRPLAGVPVTFSAPARGPSGTFAGARTVTVRTNADGIATAPVFTANTKAGSFNVTVSFASTAPPESIVLTNLAGPPARRVMVTGNAQTAAINSAFAVPLELRVTDAYGNAITDVEVTFTVQPNHTSGAAAAFNGAAEVAMLTGANGVAAAPLLIANGKRGSFIVTAFVAGIQGEMQFAMTIR